MYSSVECGMLQCCENVFKCWAWNVVRMYSSVECGMLWECIQVLSVECCNVVRMYSSVECGMLWECIQVLSVECCEDVFECWVWNVVVRMYSSVECGMLFWGCIRVLSVECCDSVFKCWVWNVFKCWVWSAAILSMFCTAAVYCQFLWNETLDSFLHLKCWHPSALITEVHWLLIYYLHCRVYVYCQLSVCYINFVDFTRPENTRNSVICQPWKPAFNMFWNPGFRGWNIEQWVYLKMHELWMLNVINCSSDCRSPVRTDDCCLTWLSLVWGWQTSDCESVTVVTLTVLLIR